MTTEQLVIQQSALLNRLVLDRDTAEEVGRVDQLWLDAQSHQVLGFTCKLGMFGNKKRAFTWAQIQSIGTDSIIVNNPPDGENAQKPERVASIIGHEVFTEAGNKVGKVVDYLLLPQTGTVINYLYSSSGWRGVLDGIYLLAAKNISTIGSKRVMVSDAVVQDPQKYSEGLTQILKDDYEKTKRDLELMKRNTRTFAEKAKEGAKNFTEQAQESAKNFAEQAQESAYDVTERAKERAQNFAEQAKETAQDVTGKAKEKAQNWAEHTKETAQDVTGKAKEKAQNWAEQAKETAQDVTGKAKEKAQSFAEQAKETAQGVTEKAKEKIASATAKPEVTSELPDKPTIEEITIKEITIEEPPEEKTLF